ncbi:MAG: chemotaxis protein CheW [Myxococcota bacterium]
MSGSSAAWLCLDVGASSYAIPLASVVEVTAAVAPRLIPLVSIHLGGIVNVRGEPLPVLDGGVLLRHQSAGRYGKILVLERKEGRLGVLVSHVSGVMRGLAPRSDPEASDEDEAWVRWTVYGGEKIGIVDPSALYLRATELLTGQWAQMGGKPCPSGL